MGVSGTVSEMLNVGETRELLFVGTTDCHYTHQIHKEFRVACSEQVHHANAFGIGSSNLSFAAKSYSCGSMAVHSWDHLLGGRLQNGLF